LSCRPDPVVQFAQFLGEHAIVLAVALLVCSIVFVAVLWRVFERHADDLWLAIDHLRKRCSSWAPVQSIIKRYPKVSLFLARRFAPGEYLGLHLTIGLVIILVTIYIFLQIADEVGEQEWLTTFDHTFSVAIHQHLSSVGFWAFAQITRLGSAPVLGVIGLSTAVALVLMRQWTLLAAWITAVIGVGVINSTLKAFFQRVRPELDNPWTTEPGWSFPSGHAMGSVVVYGFLAYMLVLMVKRSSQRFVIVASFAAITIAIGFSRLYLGVHYFSDVLAGYVVAFSWLAVCVTAYEIARQGQGSGGQVQDERRLVR
jgi:membrane-associated phospholipid phosphatase